MSASEVASLEEEKEEEEEEEAVVVVERGMGQGFLGALFIIPSIDP